MEINEKHTIKGLECCTRGRKSNDGRPCLECPYNECNLVGGTSERQIKVTCQGWLMKDALALITSKEQEINRLEKLCALRDRDCKETQDLLYKAEEKNAELEKKYALAVAEREANVKGFSETLAVIHDDTVRKMQERLEEFFDGENDYQRCSHGYIHYAVNQIAKEMIGEGK